MSISAKVISDSINEKGNRLTTLQLRYPRFIHSELMTHRSLSKNASSSRAIPVERIIQDLVSDTAVPIHWGKNQKGMQAEQEWDAPIIITRDDGSLMDCQKEEAWVIARDRAIEIARSFSDAGYHKQIVNRLLEPFVHMNTLISGTEWSNFFALRCHPDAQPEIRRLADSIFIEMAASEPKPLHPDQWHLPYVTYEETRIYELHMQIQMSVARCARVSYLTVEGAKPTVEQDMKLYERLVGSVPLHASPAEHVATPDRWIMPTYMHDFTGFATPNEHGNYIGWRQLRKMLPGNTQ